ILAKRNLPGVLARVEVNSAQRPPRRSNRRVAILIEELAIAGKSVLLGLRRRLILTRQLSLVLPASTQVADKSIELFVGELPEAGHAALPMQNRVADLVGSQLFVDIDQRRKLRRRSAAIVAMADAALVLIERDAARVGGLILDETTEPG